MSRRITIASALFVVSTALLFQSGCGGGSSPASPTPPIGGGGGGTSISINGINGNQSFAPNPASVPVGGTVSWRNADPSNIHHIVADDGSFDAGNVGPGATSAVVSIGNGAVPYHCANHPTMVGTINGSQGTGPTGPGYGVHR